MGRVNDDLVEMVQGLRHEPTHKRSPFKRLGTPRNLNSLRRRSGFQNGRERTSAVGIKEKRCDVAINCVHWICQKRPECRAIFLESVASDPKVRSWVAKERLALALEKQSSNYQSSSQCSQFISHSSSNKPIHFR